MSTSTDRLDTAYFRTSQQLSSGRRLNSAADDAAGVAIAEKMEAQGRGIQQGTANAQDMQNLLRTAEGGLNNMADALQRIRELSIQSLNDTYTDSDRAYMQKEVSQLLDFIQESAKTTQFNTMTLLDGSYADKNAQVGPGSNANMKITIQNSTLFAMGLDGYDISTRDGVDLSLIDSAIGAVNDARANIGASINRLDYTVNANETSYLNQMQALSRIADADMAKAMMERNRVQVLQQYQIFSQKEQMTRMGQNLSLLK